MAFEKGNRPEGGFKKRGSGGRLQGNILRGGLQSGQKGADLLVLRQLFIQINGFRGKGCFLPIQIIDLKGLPAFRFFLCVTAAAAEKKKQCEKKTENGPFP